jgi:hypothetical protein
MSRNNNKTSYYTIYRHLDEYTYYCDTTYMNSKKHPLRKKTWLFIVLGIIVLFILVVYAANRKQFVPTEPPLILPKTITFTQYNSLKQQPITQWKTYTNKTYGFSVKYPALAIHKILNVLLTVLVRHLL